MRCLPDCLRAGRYHGQPQPTKPAPAPAPTTHTEKGARKSESSLDQPEQYMKNSRIQRRIMKTQSDSAVT